MADSKLRRWWLPAAVVAVVVVGALLIGASSHRVNRPTMRRWRRTRQPDVGTGERHGPRRYTVKDNQGGQRRRLS